MQVLPVTCSIVLAMAISAAAAAGSPEPVVPVVWQAPSCGHDKLGQVSIQTGVRVTEATQDLLVPTVNYAGAFAKLATAAKAKGADAVIVRWHQATYFTRNGRRSHRPVHLQLRGAAIRMHADAGPCDFALADPQAFEQRASDGKPVEVGSDDAYSD